MRFSDLPLIAYLKTTRPGEKRFLALVPLTGLVTGVAAVVLVRLVAAVQKLFWGSGRELLGPALEATPLHRFFALFVGGLAVGLIVMASRQSVRGHGTAGIIEAV